MPFDFTCVHCGGKMEVSKQYGQIQCIDCGRFIDGSLPSAEDAAPSADETPVAPMDSTAPKETWRMGGVYYKGERTRWMNTLINSLGVALRQGDRQAALETCDDLISLNPNMVDAYFWRAKLTDDDAFRRENLSAVLALEPNHTEARQMMMLLNGDITAEELHRAEDLYRDNTKHTEGPVPATTEALMCPICGGALTVNADHSVVCAFCGYADETERNAIKASAASSLAVALIKQRAQPVRWEVGERIVHCNNCGAERVLPEGRLSTFCPFCGSQNIVTEDALDAIRQPEGLLKFQIGREEAEKAIEAALGSTTERLKGIFINNQVERVRYEGIFLPFWVFDIFGTVLLTESTRSDRDGVPLSGVRSENPNSLANVAVPGVVSPPPALLERIEPFNFDEVTGYSLRLLAKFSAELYTVDFPSASLEARGRFRKAMEGRYPSSNKVERTIANQINHMEMRLLLLPVWVVTIREADDDIRLALVNGQTGKAALGQARKPSQRR